MVPGIGGVVYLLRSLFFRQNKTIMIQKFMIAVLMLTVSPAITNNGFTKKLVRPTAAPEILASVPKGSPIEPDSIRHAVSGFGSRMHPVYKVRKNHDGIDLPAKKGTTVSSTSYGTVVHVEKKRYGYGWHVIVQSGHYEILYAHLCKIEVEVGQRVTPEQIIGRVGTTGTSTGFHLHYEVRENGKPINPVPFMTK